MLSKDSIEKKNGSKRQIEWGGEYYFRLSDQGKFFKVTLC